MTQKITDVKLKRFIELSLEGKQIRNATSVLYIFLSNLVDEIGYKLGLIPRIKASNEMLSGYMELINRIFQVNFEIKIFPVEQITTIKVIETLFEHKKSKEEFPQTYLKQLTQLYFDVRNTQIPNLQEHLNDTDIMENRTISWLSFLSKQNQANSKNQSPIRPILLHRIHQDQKRLTTQLQERLDKEALVRLIQLKSIEKSLLSQSQKKKMLLLNKLQDKIDYSFITSNTGYFVTLGFLIAFLLLSIVCIAEMLLFGFVTVVISSFLLICILIVVFFSYINKKWFHNKS